MKPKNKAPHGGARAGAGRPKNPPELLASMPATDDARTFLMALMNDSEADIRLRLEAAKCLMRYQNPKPGEAGNKEQAQDAAKKVIASGKFSASAPPLRSVQ